MSPYGGTKMIYLNPKRIPIKIVVFALIILVILCVLTTAQISLAMNNQRVTCKFFNTQADAQGAYNNDPKRYATLDGYDKDGKVCEFLPKNKI